MIVCAAYVSFHVEGRFYVIQWRCLHQQGMSYGSSRTSLSSFFILFSP